MNAELMKPLLQTNRSVYGTMITTVHPPSWMWMLRELALDFVVVDTEHAPLSRSDAARMLATISHVGCSPFLRVASATELLVRQGLDAGAQGILLPYCEHPDEVARCIRAARFRPVKGERLSRHFQGDELPPKTLAAVAVNNRDALTVVGIESVVAIDRLESILGVEGIDAVYVGTQDLSYSLGCPGEFEHPELVRAFEFIAKTCKHRRMAWGIWPLPLELSKRWIDRGMNFVLHSSDYYAIKDGYTRDFELLRTRGRKRNGR